MIKEKRGYPVKWALRILLSIALVLCGILLLGTFTKLFSCPNFIVSILKWMAWVSLFATVFLGGWKISGLIFVSRKGAKKSTVANPIKTPTALLAIYFAFLTGIFMFTLQVTGKFPTGFQEEVLGLLREILEYVKPD